MRVNLARCAMWFNSLGIFDTAVPVTGEQNQVLAPDTITAHTPYGELVRPAPPLRWLVIGALIKFFCCRSWRSTCVKKTTKDP